MVMRERLILPNGADKLLLHSCCAPCSGEVMEALLFSEINFSIFFYNPNIHPVQEYEIRKAENVAFAEKHNIPFIDVDYDKDNWFARAKGMEWEPERGKRYGLCSPNATNSFPSIWPINSARGKLAVSNSPTNCALRNTVMRSETA